MLKYLSILFLGYLFYSCSSQFNKSDIDYKNEVMDSLKFKGWSSYYNNHIISLYGGELGNLPQYVWFSNIKIKPQGKSIEIEGQVRDSKDKGYLTEVLVIIGSLDSHTTGDKYKIIPTNETMTDNEGKFKLISKVYPEDKLFFVYLSYFSVIYDINKLFY